MMTHRRRLGFLIAGIFVAAITASMIFPRFVAPSPAKGVIRPTEQRLVAPPGGSAVYASFQIRNIGGSALVVEDVSTSCGCTLASISSRRIEPGTFSTVSLEATAPAGGRKHVEVRIITDEKPTKELVHRIELLGKAEMPFVTIHSEVVQLGQVQPGIATAEAYVETQEVAGTEPWIRSVKCSLDGVKVDSKVEEVPFGVGQLSRRYTYALAFADLREIGPVVGEFSLLGEKGEGNPILRLPVRGQVVSPVYSTPKLLYANYPRGQLPPALTVSIAAADAEFPLDVALAKDYPGIDVKLLSKSKNRSTFQVQFVNNDHATEDLRFRTNHPRVTSIGIPLRLRALP